MSEFPSQPEPTAPELENTPSAMKDWHEETKKKTSYPALMLLMLIAFGLSIFFLIKIRAVTTEEVVLEPLQNETELQTNTQEQQPQSTDTLESLEEELKGLDFGAEIE